MFGKLFSQDPTRQVQRTQARIERKIDMLMEHAGLIFDPLEGVAESVATALRAGRKIEAIKIYRAETGAGLREAKDYVEGIPL